MAASLVSGSVLGRYRITGTLGHGGTGVVYSAVREGTERKVALKVLRADLAEQPAVRRRFLREARTLAGVYSPHIIDIYEYGEQDGCLFIATSLVDGHDLRRELADRGCLEPAEALAVVEQISSALAEAHEAGVIHRDIKPSNILLHRLPEGCPFAYLCDFGIAVNPDDRDTPPGAGPGTHAYMAPERHAGAPATVASDLYSLGCVLFEVLTGGPPYRGTDVQVAVQHLEAAVPQCAASGVVAGALNAILQRAMAKDPEARYDSAVAMGEDVKRAAALAASRPGEGLGPARADGPDGSDGSEATDGARPPPEPRTGDGLARRARERRRRLEWASLVASAVAVLVAVGGVSVTTRSGERADCVGAEALSDPACQIPGWAAPPVADRFSCWDGRAVARRSECTAPAGMRGLLWVFPSLKRDLPGCHQLVDPTVDPSLRQWRCRTEGGAGTRSAVTYTEWLTPEAARSHYARVFDRPAVNFVVGDKASGYRWWTTEPDDRGRVSMSVAYLSVPFSASLTARSSHGLDRACASVVARSLRSFDGESLVCSRPGRSLPSAPDRS